MSITQSWSRLLHAANDYPNAMAPAAMHGYSVARVIDLAGMETTPWLEDMLGVEGPDEITEAVQEAADQYLMDLLQSFTELADMEVELPAFDSTAEEHWARQWARGFLRAVGARHEAWDEHCDNRFMAKRILFSIRLLDDPRLFSELSGRSAGEHAAFVERHAPAIRSYIRLLYEDVLIGSRLDPDAFEDEYDDDEEQDTDIELPVCNDAELAESSNEDLVELLCALDDRVPENVIRECAARGESIAPLLEEIIQAYREPERIDSLQWWAVLHCIHVLGLIPGASASRVLIQALKLREEDPDDYLWEWVAGYWPALFANKLEHVRPDLWAIAADKTHDWMLRAEAIDCLAADPDEREANLDRIAALADDASDTSELRELAGGVLLSYPRERHRELLLGLAEEQSQRAGLGPHFDEMDVLYAHWKQEPDWKHRFLDPMSFYHPDNILKRQHRWRREDREWEEHERLWVRAKDPGGDHRARRSQDRSQRPLPVRKRQEIQKMLPQHMKLSSFEAIARALSEAKVRYLIAGGLAVNAHGYLRFTKDIDIVLQLEPDNTARAIAALEGLGFRPTVPVDAARFAEPAQRRDWIQNKNMKVFQLWSDDHRDTPVDIFVDEPFDFEEEFRNALIKPLYGEIEVRFVSLPTLIRMKEAVGRPQDLVDLDELNAIQKDQDNEKQ